MLHDCYKSPNCYRNCSGIIVYDQQISIFFLLTQKVQNCCSYSEFVMIIMQNLAEYFIGSISKAGFLRLTTLVKIHHLQILRLGVISRKFTAPATKYYY